MALGSDHKKATLSDVAQHSGVSRMTVSRVVNDHPSVNDATREKVQASIKAVNYEPRKNDEQIPAPQSDQVCFLAAETSSVYQGDLLIGAMSAVEVAGLHLFVHRVPNDVSLERLKRELSSDWAGVIIPPPMSDVEGVRRLVEAIGLPAVFMGVSGRKTDVYEVGIDDAKATEEMTDFLLSAGHKRIGFIQGHPSHGASRFRQIGYEASLKKAGVSMDARLVAPGFFTYRSGFDAGVRLLSVEDRPTAIFASNDDMAIGVICAAMQQGLRVPQDLSVVGVDDLPMAKNFWPGLTTIKQPLHELSKKAVEILAFLIVEKNGESQLGAVPPSKVTYMDHAIVKRESAVSINW